MKIYGCVNRSICDGQVLGKGGNPDGLIRYWSFFKLLEECQRENGGTCHDKT